MATLQSLRRGKSLSCGTFSCVHTKKLFAKQLIDVGGVFSERLVGLQTISLSDALDRVLEAIR